MSKERPILMNGAMVRAVLDGRKTQTRRVSKYITQYPPASTIEIGFLSKTKFGEKLLTATYEATNGKFSAEFCPYGKPGDRLWVRETWARDSEDGTLFYRADVGSGNGADDWQRNIADGASGYCWRPSIYMPRCASRILLEITGVRVERLQDISVGDCCREGAPLDMTHAVETWYRELWESINGLGSWDVNPWVWVIEFKAIKP